MTDPGGKESALATTALHVLGDDAMPKCGICGRKNAELYPVDDHIVCDICLAQGRLDELPEIESASRQESELVGAGATRSSWWNREIPERVTPQ
ncbi:MAG TPA: hypothetical protein VEJ41_08450 [Candidatus Acidoferrales bacterium]|nr:hypothetical protein [Candidatus Acidoferrales bacterium]